MMEETNMVDIIIAEEKYEIHRREKIVRTEKEFDINGTKVMAYSRKDAIKRLKHKK